MRVLESRVWHSSESTCLPPIWPEFDFPPSIIHGLSLLVLFSVLRGFSLGTPVLPAHQKPKFDLV